MLQFEERNIQRSKGQMRRYHAIKKQIRCNSNHKPEFIQEDDVTKINSCSYWFIVRVITLTRWAHAAELRDRLLKEGNKVTILKF